MNQFAHGGDRYRNEINIDFSINVNPLGIPENIKSVYESLIDEVEYYPDIHAQELKNKIAGKYGIREENILLGNGASELLMIVVHALAPEKIVIPVPSFAGYQHVVRAIDATVMFHNMSDSYRLDRDILEKLDESVDMLLLANPNNPTGAYIDNDLLKEILDKCKQNSIAVVLDECFMELSDECKDNTLINQIYKWPNLLLLRAFTKTYAIPGIRLGYLVCVDKRVMEKLNKHTPEWNVSCIAQKLGTDLLDNDQYIDKAVELIKVERKFLIGELKALGCTVLESKTNFILFKNEEDNDAIDWYKQLLTERILIRDCKNYEGLDKGFYRIAVRNHKHNELLIKTMKRIKRHEN